MMQLHFPVFPPAHAHDMYLHVDSAAVTYTPTTALGDYRAKKNLAKQRTMRVFGLAYIVLARTVESYTFALFTSKNCHP